VGWFAAPPASVGYNYVDDLVQEAFARIWAADLAMIAMGALLVRDGRHLLAEYARRILIGAHRADWGKSTP